jgi:hypothetical protein
MWHLLYQLCFQRVMKFLAFYGTQQFNIVFIGAAKIYTFRITDLRDVIPSILVDKYHTFGGTYRLQLQGSRVKSSTLKIEAASSSETFPSIYQTISCHIHTRLQSRLQITGFHKSWRISKLANKYYLNKDSTPQIELIIHMSCCEEPG